ncbi:hypothetical protein QJS66_02380 [Kocuria rhizophila]|nr:hypothetical protein QJS66_02380 [Kocuria rhizophila]
MDWSLLEGVVGRKTSTRTTPSESRRDHLNALTEASQTRGSRPRRSPA